MLKKLSVMLLIFFLSSPCMAQQPRIDSIVVDEDKGELVLHGNFQNSSSAIVLVDSVSLPVILATDSLIRAMIPDSGKGSAGWVSITINGNQSNKKLLTYFHFEIYYFSDHRYSRGNYEMRLNADTIHTRADILTHTGIDYMLLSKISRCHDVAEGHGGPNSSYNGPKYDTSVIWKVPILFEKSFYFRFDNLDAAEGSQDFEAQVTLDGNYEIIPFSGSFFCGNSGGGECWHWNPIAPTDFPPSSAVVSETPSNPNILQARLSSDPINSNANLIVTLQNATHVQKEIIDILGHIISSDEKMLPAGMNKLPINYYALASGIYICRLQAGGEVVSVRFVKE